MCGQTEGWQQNEIPFSPVDKSVALNRNLPSPPPSLLVGSELISVCHFKADELKGLHLNLYLGPKSYFILG